MVNPMSVDQRCQCGAMVRHSGVQCWAVSGNAPAGLWPRRENLARFRGLASLVKRFGFVVLVREDDSLAVRESRYDPPDEL